jgi:hydroxymethylpyrimidine/phosphomethylpyrimidine kinase
VARVLDEVEVLQRARHAARAYATAVAHMVEFIERSSAVLDPAQLAEYEALLAREESTRALRQDAFHELGLVAPSIER